MPQPVGRPEVKVNPFADADEEGVAPWVQPLLKDSAFSLLIEAYVDTSFVYPGQGGAASFAIDKCKGEINGDTIQHFMAEIKVDCVLHSSGRLVPGTPASLVVLVHGNAAQVRQASAPNLQAQLRRESGEVRECGRSHDDDRFRLDVVVVPFFLFLLVARFVCRKYRTAYSPNSEYGV